MRRGRRHRLRFFTALPIAAGLALCAIPLIPQDALIRTLVSILARGEGCVVEHAEEGMPYIVDAASGMLPIAGVALMLLGFGLALWPRRLWVCERCGLVLPRRK